MSQTSKGYQKNTMAQAIYNKIPITKFTTSGLTNGTDNAQTRAISGINPPFGKCYPEMIKIAKNNIKQHFLNIGITESIESLVKQLKKDLKWTTNTQLTHSNNSNERLPLPILNNGGISEKEKKIIEEFNYLDVQLYQYVVENLEN